MKVSYLVTILPGLIVDFLPRVGALNTVVTELISQQHTRPWLAAVVMASVSITIMKKDFYVITLYCDNVSCELYILCLQTFEQLLVEEMKAAIDPSPSVADWVMLSLDSFVQQ